MRRFLTLSCFVLTSSLVARPGNNAPATSILGQTSQSTYVEQAPPTQSSLSRVDGVAIDPTSGKLFVSDTGNNRILRYSSAQAYQTGAPAEAVFGQPDFVSSATNRGNPDLDMSGIADPSADSFDSPANLCVDLEGRLWVADNANARVLRFDNAATKPSFTATADAVIGQPGYTSSAIAANHVADSGFASPAGVAVDAEGRLWVSDALIPRILRFDDAATLSGDAVADGYFGETDGDFDIDSATFDASPVTASSLGASPYGIALDPSGNLWVADVSNNRVLFYEAPASKANGAAADKVLGQGGFATRDNPEPPTATSMNSPFYVAVAPDGTLWVSDFLNYRVLGFLNAAEKINGAGADLVLGQADFISNTANVPSPTAVDSPSQIAFGREGSLFLGQFIDKGSVKRWSDPVTITAPKSRRTSASGSATLRGTASGATKVEYRVPGRGGFKAARGTAKAWSVRLSGLTRKNTVVTVRSVAFDDRIASAKVTVKKPR